MRWVGVVNVLCLMALSVGVSGMFLIQFSPFFALLLLLPIVCVVAGNQIRCPRCGRHVLDTGHGYYAPWLRQSADCIGCGRSKADVWPFQRAFRPEPPKA